MSGCVLGDSWNSFEGMQKPVQELFRERAERFKKVESSLPEHLQRVFSYLISYQENIKEHFEELESRAKLAIGTKKNCSLRRDFDGCKTSFAKYLKSCQTDPCFLLLINTSDKKIAQKITAFQLIPRIEKLEPGSIFYSDLNGDFYPHKEYQNKKVVLLNLAKYADRLNRKKLGLVCKSAKDLYLNKVEPISNFSAISKVGEVFRDIQGIVANFSHFEKFYSGGGFEGRFVYNFSFEENGEIKLKKIASFNLKHIKTIQDKRKRKIKVEDKLFSLEKNVLQIKKGAVQSGEISLLNKITGFFPQENKGKYYGRMGVSVDFLINKGQAFLENHSIKIYTSTQREDILFQIYCFKAAVQNQEAWKAFSS